MAFHKSIAPFAALLFLAACAPQGAPNAEMRIAISPAAQPASAALLACIPSSDELIVSIESLYSGTFELADFDLFIRLGESSEPEFAAQLATENIVIILAPDNTASMTRAEAAALFSGQDESTELWIGPESDEARQLFETEVMLGSPVDGEAQLAANPEDILAAVAGNPSAAGVLPAAWADSRVQAVNLDLNVPLLAVAMTEPQGAARQVLACLQGESGQAALAELYNPLP
jgi:hypothetical protein